MLKNVKGFILTETIITLTVVATVITIVYATIMNYYIKQNNNITKFNTTQDLYTSRDLKKYFDGRFGDAMDKYSNILLNKDAGDIMSFCSDTNSTDDKDEDVCDKLNVKQAFLAKDKLNFNEFVSSNNLPNTIKADILKQEFKKDKCSYRYIFIFKDNSYSTIGVDCYEGN